MSLHPSLAGPVPEQTAKMLVEKHQDKLLKLFNLWPFGNLGEASKSEKPTGE